VAVVAGAPSPGTESNESGQPVTATPCDRPAFVVAKQNSSPRPILSLPFQIEKPMISLKQQDCRKLIGAGTHAKLTQGLAKPFLKSGNALIVLRFPRPLIAEYSLFRRPK